MKKKSLLKNLTAVVLSAAMIMSMAGCGSATSETTSSSEETTETTTETAAEDTTEAATEETASNDGEVVELEFWGWWSSDARKPHIEKMVNDFNESQDRIHVTYVDIPWGDIFTKNIAQIAAGNPCDVMAGNFGDVSYRASQSQLTALDDYMGDFSLDKFYDNFAQGCLGEDGKTYAVPLVADTRFIYYNKDLFAAVGVSEEAGNLPKTWDELRDLAFSLDQMNDDGTLDVMGFHPNLGNGGVDTWITNANGGKAWYDTTTDELIINTDTNKKALEYMMSYTDHYTSRVVDEYQAAFDSGMADPFCSGKLAMLIQTNAYRAAIKQNAPDLNYGILQMPEMTEGNGHYVNGGGFTLEVPYGAKHPAEAMEFIKWMTSDEIQSYWALNMGEVPTIKEVTNEELSNDLVYEASLNALQETYIGEYPNEISGFKDIITPETDLVLVGQKSIDDALADADKTVRATYGLE